MFILKTVSELGFLQPICGGSFLGGEPSCQYVFGCTLTIDVSGLDRRFFCTVNRLAAFPPSTTAMADINNTEKVQLHAPDLEELRGGKDRT